MRLVASCFEESPIQAFTMSFSLNQTRLLNALAWSITGCALSYAAVATNSHLVPIQDHAGADAGAKPAAVRNVGLPVKPAAAARRS